MPRGPSPERGRSAPPTDGVAVYGATGFTGRLVVTEAVARGLRPVLLGRSAARLAAVAEPLGLAWHVAPLDRHDHLVRALRSSRLVVHTAGPFSATWRPVLDACLEAHVDYLDVGAEVGVVELLVGNDALARHRDVMVMPGAAFAVAADDALAVHVTRARPGAEVLSIAMRTSDVVSRGSLRSMVEQTGGIAVREGGRLVRRRPAETFGRFDFGAGPVGCVGISLAGVTTAWRSTGVPNVALYLEADAPLRTLVRLEDRFGNLAATPAGQATLRRLIGAMPEGPSPVARAAYPSVLVAEAVDGGGERWWSRLHGPNVYDATASLAVEIAARVLAGDRQAGFRTPGQQYGPDLPLTVPGFTRVDSWRPAGAA